MCACTEPVGTGIGAVCVECGRPKWPILHILAEKIEKTLYTPRMTRYDEAFFPWKTKKKKGFALWALRA